MEPATLSLPYIGILATEAIPDDFEFNTTNNSDDSHKLDMISGGLGHPLPRGLVTFLVAIISVFVIVSNIVNLSVLRITEQIPPISRVCLLNLSFADLMVGLISCIPCVYPAVTGRWPYGAVWCQLAGMVHGTSVTVSIWSLALVSIDRYLAILHPLRYNAIMTLSRCKMVISCFWTFALVTFFIPLPTKSNFIYYQFSPEEVMCGLYWEYPWFCIVTAVYIPVLAGSILLFTTIGIAKEVVSMTKVQAHSVAPQVPEKNTTRLSEKVSKRDLKPVKVLGVTVLVYFTAWAPYVVQVVLLSFYKHLSVPALVRFGTIWLANCNSFMNVIIYSVMYSGFRKNAAWLFRLIAARISCAEDPPRVTQESSGRQSSS